MGGGGRVVGGARASGPAQRGTPGYGQLKQLISSAEVAGASLLPPTLRGHRGRANWMSWRHIPGYGPVAAAQRAAGGGAGGSWCPRGLRAVGLGIALAWRRRGRRQPEPHGAGPGAGTRGPAWGAAPPRPPPEPWVQAVPRRPRLEERDRQAAGGGGGDRGQRGRRGWQGA